uniref:Uncharacterized protein LOC104219738 n=1 Tax=Nicotiana sylvestris TaxID=4096 RepID=A0A1U7VL92_NICSY|nr:PREDICTED: uncharacterized protein LOC104219738 [Nicotiana sylvestris]
MNTVAPHLFSGIVYASDAHLVREDLRERFDKVNRVRIFQLHREIATISQGTDSVSMYFTRLKELWAEYDAMIPSPNCGCLKSKENVEHFLQQRLLQFLSGLNDSYDQARRQIIMKTTEPTLNQAYAMIIERESQLTPTSGVNSIYYPGNYGPGVYNQGYNTNKHGWFSGGEHRDSNLTNDVNQVFDQGQGNNNETEPTANVAGIVTPSTPNDRNDKWIVDSGATNHMVGDSDMLSTVTKRENQKVLLPNGSRVPITHTGSSELLQGSIHNVLCVPEFKFNLLSVAKLTRELRFLVAFYPDFCLMQDLHNGKVKGIGKMEEDLYHWHSKNKRTSPIVPSVFLTVHDEEKLWHIRLGHLRKDIKTTLSS